MSQSGSETFSTLLRNVLGPDVPDGLVPKSTDERPTSEITPYEEVCRRAQRLLNALVIRFELDSPAVISYRSAYRLLSGDSGAVPPEWSMACAKWLVRFCAETEPVILRLLGRVCLDAFLVSAETRRPRPEHWATAGYGQQAWEALFGDAELWPEDQLAQSRRRR